MSTNTQLRAYSGAHLMADRRMCSLGAVWPLGPDYLYATDTFNCIANNCDNELEKFDPRTGAYLGAVGSINTSTVPYSGVTNMAVSLNGLALGPGGSLHPKRRSMRLGTGRLAPSLRGDPPIRRSSDSQSTLGNPCAAGKILGESST